MIITKFRRKFKFNFYSDDKNKDGFIDYPEFIAAQQAASAAAEK